MLHLSEPGQVQNGQVIPWPVAPTPTAPTGPIDPRAEDLAMERAESSPFELARFIAAACADAERYDWLSAGTLARKVLRGEDCTTRELLVVMVAGPEAARLRALHLLTEQLRADPAFQRAVFTDYLPEAIRDVESQDEADRDGAEDEAAAAGADYSRGAW